MIERAQAVHSLEQRLLDQRGQLLSTQKEINEARCQIVEIKKRLYELSNASVPF